MIIINENKNFLFRNLIFLLIYYLLLLANLTTFQVGKLIYPLILKKIKLFLYKNYIDKGDFNRPEMTAKLICTLETVMYRAMQEKQYSAVASNAKVLMKLIGLEPKIKS